MDSLRIARNAALSSIITTEAQAGITSANIANADVDGYTAKIASLVTTATGGTATGVDLSSISTYVDENLVRSLMAASSDESYAQTLADYLGAVSSALGSTDSESTIANRITALQTALANLAGTPESDSLKYTAVEAAAKAAESLRDLSDEVQQQRTNVDQQIESSIADLNDALDTIDQLNEAIVKAQALGQETNDLEDARRQALATVADKLDVNYFTTSTGELHVYTKSGVPLVDSSAHTLAYEAAGSVSAGMDSGDFDAITIDGKSVTDKLNGGEIGALLELRDETLPAIQDELDALASALIEQMNAISNQGTAVPAPQTLTGTTMVNAGDGLSGSGTLRIALVDSDGVVDTMVDLDLTSYGTVGDLVSAINGISGISASLDSEGHLTISADDSSLGVAINQMDSAVGSDGEGASSYFGLNDLFTGTSAADITVRADLAEDSTRLPVGTLSDDAALAAGDTGVTAGDATIAEALEALLDDPISLPAAGNLSATSTTLANYATGIVSDVATRSSLATSNAETAALVADDLGNSLSNESGVNLNEETARLSALEDRYAASSQIFEVLSEMFEALLDAVA